MTKEEFIEKAKLIHCDEGIDYSKVEYINNRTKVLLIDPIYGEFWQTPSNHLKGQKNLDMKEFGIVGYSNMFGERKIEKSSFFLFYLNIYRIK